MLPLGGESGKASNQISAKRVEGPDVATFCLEPTTSLHTSEALHQASQSVLDLSHRTDWGEGECTKAQGLSDEV